MCSPIKPKCQMNRHIRVDINIHVADIYSAELRYAYATSTKLYTHSYQMYVYSYTSAHMRGRKLESETSVRPACVSVVLKAMLPIVAVVFHNDSLHDVPQHE